MNLFIYMMLLNMVAVRLMIYFLKCNMTIILKWYFEIIFIPKKIVLTVILKSLSFWDLVSTISESNSICSSLWNDIWLSFWNKQSIPVFVLKCFMTVILKWGRQKFSSTKLFSLIKTEEIYWRKITDYLYFSYTDFYAVSMSLHLRWNTFY